MKRTKLSFKAQIVFETDKWKGFNALPTDKRKEITHTKVKQAINEQKCEAEIVGSELSCEQFPTIIIRHRNK